ncbi:Sec-independent protein translocase protein TatB [Litoreibacter arenae]|uniref:Sec-independent protein translocase protein TatB n=1 Tax=Litoreibacter arenae DSM 19593 TaxID=1123360 RepID=S9QEX3_9RHOB|nr:Sec-independent protein translocase protein TatB [Litoreibacter arenae]EPX79976.1 Twin-arginine translocation protein TatB [Litoreibacter arenae DSM 19593]
MFDIGMTELLVIGLVALVVVGPKDLPGMFRTLGQFTAKAKRMAREFSRAMEDAADEAGVKDVSKTLQAAANPKKMGIDKIREATNFDKYAEGSETQKLAKKRAADAEKIQAATAKAAEARKAKEAEAEAAKAEPKPKVAAKPKPTPKSKAAPKAKATPKPKTATKAKPATKPRPKAKKADT